MLKAITEMYGEPPEAILQDAEQINLWIAEHDPGRIWITCELILEEELEKYAEYYAAQAEQDDLIQPMIMMVIPSPSTNVPPVTNLQFYGVQGVSSGAQMTIAYPYPASFTNIDIFACTDLLVQAWSLLCTTNIDSSTNHVCLIDTDVTNGFTRRFYHVWNADYDGDLDLMSDGCHGRSETAVNQPV